MLKFNLVQNDDQGNITVVIDGDMFVASSDHPNWDRIVAGAIAGDDSIEDLFDQAQAVAQRFENLSERVSVAHGHVYFDGDEINNTLTNQILRFIEEGEEDLMPLVNFFEKVQQNPNEHSRDYLYRWLDAADFTITDEGDIVGYKGVSVDTDGTHRSIQSGPAVVNGESKNGRIPNPVGAVIEMPRSSVNHDPSVGCSTGLHVGTWSYARGFSQGATLKVTVNPRDVVSVPTDCSDQKMRVCRYKVVETAEAPIASAVERGYGYYDPDDEDDAERYNDECPDCGDEVDGSGYCDYCDDYTA